MPALGEAADMVHHKTHHPTPKHYPEGRPSHAGLPARLAFTLRFRRAVLAGNACYACCAESWRARSLDLRSACRMGSGTLQQPSSAHSHR